MSRRSRGTSWYALSDEIESGLSQSEEHQGLVQVDHSIQRLGGGLNHENYVFRATPTKSGHRREQSYILRKPCRTHTYESDEAVATSLANEARTLRTLAQQKLGFTVPVFVVWTAPGGLIETAVPGICMDELMRLSDRHLFVLESVARIAAEVHRLPPDGFDHLPRQVDGRGHILSRLAAFPADFMTRNPEAVAVGQWVRDHLPQTRPVVLLHGDLLPQNLLLDLATEKIAVVDWEFAQLGDPAYDLAIVSRGRRQPFKRPEGLKCLVKAYRQAGGAAISVTDVVTHELLMVLEWLLHSIENAHNGRREGHPPEKYGQDIRSILRRARRLEASAT